MRIGLASVVRAVWMLCLTPMVIAAPVVEVVPKDMGLIYQGGHVSVDVKLINLGERAITFDGQVKDDWNPLQVVNLPLSIEPGEFVYAQVKGEVVAPVGRRSFPILLLNSSSSETRARLTLSALVYSVFDGVSDAVDLGIVPDGSIVSKEIPFSTDEVADFTLLGAKDPNGYVDVAVGLDGKSVIVSSKSGLPWGVYEGTVTVDTDFQHQPRLTIDYTFEVRGRVVLSRQEVEFGWERIGEHAPQVVFLNDEGGGELKVGSVSVDGKGVNISQSECPGGKVNCRALNLEVDKDVGVGRFFGVVSVPLVDFNQVLKFKYGGIVLSQTAEVKDIDLKELAAQNRQPILDDALRGITSSTQEPIRAPVPEGEGPLLKWSIKNETDVFAYVIYRSASEEGPLHVVSRPYVYPISTTKERSQVVEYFWRDTAAGENRENWYRIGTIDRRGHRSWLSPMIEVRASNDSAEKGG